MLVECRNAGAICRGTICRRTICRRVWKPSKARAEESGVMWLVVAQLLPNHFPLVNMHDKSEISYISQRLLPSDCILIDGA